MLGDPDRIEAQFLGEHAILEFLADQPRVVIGRAALMREAGPHPDMHGPLSSSRSASADCLCRVQYQDGRAGQAGRDRQSERAPLGSLRHDQKFRPTPISTSCSISSPGDRRRCSRAWLYRWRLRESGGDRRPGPGRLYVVALAAGAIGGAWAFGSWNTALGAMPHPSHSIAGALAGGIVAVELYKWARGIRGSTGAIWVGPLALGIAVGRWGCLLRRPRRRDLRRADAPALGRRPRRRHTAPSGPALREPGDARLPRDLSARARAAARPGRGTAPFTCSCSSTRRSASSGSS